MYQLWNGKHNTPMKLYLEEMSDGMNNKYRAFLVEYREMNYRAQERN